MGLHYSLISVFSSPRETNNINVQTNSKTKKRKRRHYKRNHLLNRFFLGSKHFLSNTQPHTCLFNEYYYLNSRRHLVNPIPLQISLPEITQPIVTHPIQCTIAIRRDSLKIIHCYDDYYSIDFTFDADRPVQIFSRSHILFISKFIDFSFSVYFMAHELYANNSGSLSYTCCAKLSHLDTFKQFYAFNRSAGHGQVFSSIPNDIRFPLTILNEAHHTCTIKSRVYPLVIVCREISCELLK